jgi:hypothetical protein
MEEFLGVGYQDGEDGFRRLDLVPSDWRLSEPVFNWGYASDGLM